MCIGPRVRSVYDVALVRK